METAFFSQFQESEALRKITDQICKGFRGKRLLSGSTRLPILTPTTRFPSSLVSLSNMDIVIKEASAKETTDVKHATTAMLQLPEPVADTLPNGLRVPEFHLVHAQQYHKQQGQTPYILRRSCSLGTNDPQRPTFHIARCSSFHVDRFSHPTVDRHPTFIVDRSTSFDIYRYYTAYIDRSLVAKHGCDCYSQTGREWKPV
ncbi:hypothetical protein DY000_02045196 [Brassica cretica]|uniref:Uncharacterized protein n=1 Tax=Brassica cretica TaxID=69181 RepID=A0ABQ7ETP8_BRACR|nr:hypothetical protein DY000_02045196 [Brassica cretica]